MSSTISRRQATISLLPAATPIGALKEGRIIVTPETAARMLEKFKYEGQRNISPLHVAKLAAQMTAGVWTEGSQLAFGVLPDGATKLVNGYHRLSAVIKSGVAIEFQSLLVPAKDEAELHALYYRFDVVQADRSGRMVMRSTGIGERLGISKEALLGAYGAGVIIETGLTIVHSSKADPIHGTPDGKLAAIEPWWDFVKQYDDTTIGAPVLVRRKMLKPSFMAVALVTLKYQPTKAMGFWSGVAQDDGLTKGDPRKAMLHILANVDLTNAAPDSALIYAANCWNAWFRGERLEFTKKYENSVCRPLGTPFASNGKRRA